LSKARWPAATRPIALNAKWQGGAMAEGDLESDANPADLARFVTTVMHGIAVQAASGASRDELERAAKIALRAWPA
jgi:hypothetical protein